MNTFLLNIGEFIYPGLLKSRLNIDIISAYNFMEDLKEKDFVKNVYEVYCMNCNKSKGKFLDSLTDFKDSYACDFCNKDLNIADDVIVLYKVISL